MTDEQLATCESPSLPWRQGMPSASEVEMWAGTYPDSPGWRQPTMYSPDSDDPSKETRAPGPVRAGMWLAFDGAGPHRSLGDHVQHIHLAVIEGKVYLRNGYSFWQRLDQTTWGARSKWLPCRRDGIPIALLRRLALLDRVLDPAAVAPDSVAVRVQVTVDRGSVYAMTAGGDEAMMANTQHVLDERYGGDNTAAIKGGLRQCVGLVRLPGGDQPAEVQELFARSGALAEVAREVDDALTRMSLPGGTPPPWAAGIRTAADAVEDTVAAEHPSVRALLDSLHVLPERWTNPSIGGTDILSRLGLVIAQRDRAWEENRKAYLADAPGSKPPHDDSPECPTYYDGCNCYVAVLDHNIRRAVEAERRLKVAEEAFAPLLDAFLKCDFDPACPPVATRATLALEAIRAPRGYDEAALVPAAEGVTAKAVRETVTISAAEFTRLQAIETAARVALDTADDFMGVTNLGCEEGVLLRAALAQPGSGDGA